MSLFLTPLFPSYCISCCSLAMFAHHHTFVLIFRDGLLIAKKVLRSFLLQGLNRLSRFHMHIHSSGKTYNRTYGKFIVLSIKTVYKNHVKTRKLMLCSASMHLKQAPIISLCQLFLEKAEANIIIPSELCTARKYDVILTPSCDVIPLCSTSFAFTECSVNLPYVLF